MKELALLKLMGDLMLTAMTAMEVVQRVNAVLAKAKESGDEITDDMQAELDAKSLEIKTQLDAARKEAGFIN